MIPSKKSGKNPLKSAESTAERKYQRGTKRPTENNNVEASIQTMKDSYRSSFPPQHPSLSQDLNMKPSS
jgi:hypothetical protein